MSHESRDLQICGTTEIKKSRMRGRESVKTRAVNRAAVEKRRVLGEKKTIAIFDAGYELSWDLLFFFFEMKR